MPDSTFWLALVVILLAAGAWRQFVRVGPIGRLLDTLGLVPQWRFFAQSEIAGDHKCFADVHVLARRARADGPPTDWQPVFWLEERTLTDAIWNPRRRGSDQLHEFAQVLCDPSRGSDLAARITGIPYLSILRLCLDRTALADGEQLQFAIATTQGRGERTPEIEFCSAWHTN